MKKLKNIKFNITEKQWRIIVDELTQLKILNFFETNDGMFEPTCVKLKKWIQTDKIVKNMQLDSAGENFEAKEES